MLKEHSVSAVYLEDSNIVNNTNNDNTNNNNNDNGNNGSSDCQHIDDRGYETDVDMLRAIETTADLEISVTGQLITSQMDNTSQSSKNTQTSTAWFELSFVAFDDRLKFDLLCKGIVMLTMIFMFTGVVNFFSSFYPVILHETNATIVQPWPVDSILLMINIIAIDVSSAMFIVCGFLAAYLHSSMQTKDSIDMIKIVAIYMVIDISIANILCLVFGSVFHLVHHSFKWNDFGLTLLQTVTALSVFEWKQSKNSWHSFNPTAWPALCLLYAHSLVLCTMSGNQRMMKFGQKVCVGFMLVNCVLPIFVISLFALLNDDTNIFFTNATNMGYRLFEFNTGVCTYGIIRLYKTESMYYVHLLSSISYGVFLLFMMIWCAELGIDVKYEEKTCVRMYYFSPCIKFHHGFLMRGCFLGLTLIARVLNLDSSNSNFYEYNDHPANLYMDTESEFTVKLKQTNAVAINMPFNIADCVTLITFTWPICYIINLLLEINFGYKIVQQNSALLIFVLPHIICLIVYVWNRFIKLNLFHFLEQKFDIAYTVVITICPCYSSSQ